MKVLGGLPLVVGSIAVSALMATSPATAAPRETGLELGLRTGYAIPFGKGGENATADLSEIIAGSVPIWVDVGYRAAPNVMVGMYFMYGIGVVGNTWENLCPGGASCETHDVRLGAQVHYHFLPQTSADPWVGAGIGYEWLTLGASDGSDDASITVHGLEFFNLQAGLDLKPSDDVNFGIGPFVSFQLAQYSGASCSGSSDCVGDYESSVHQWLTLGIRGTFVP